MAKTLSKAKKLSIFLSLVWRNPSYGLDRILTELPEKEGKKIFSRSGIQKALTKLGLNTAKKRQAWARRIKTVEAAAEFATAKAQKRVKTRRGVQLLPEERLQMIRLVEREEMPVSRAAQAYGVSRKNFYKWKKRYEVSVPGKEYQAVCDQRPIIERRWNQLTDKQAKVILKIIREHPEYSTHKVAQILAEVGNHGIQNAFQRLNLNTYEKRLAYAQAHPIVTPVVKVLDWLKPILGRIPVISAIPPPAIEKIASLIPPFLLGLFASPILFLVFYQWLEILVQAPTTASRLGLIFASVSLSVGSLFFLYSMKYYFTLAVVLSFSRTAGEQGIEQRVNNMGEEDKGWIGRIFGLVNNFRNNRNHREERPSGVGFEVNLRQVKLKRKPFVSIHLPFYNEKKVADRILAACTAMDYPNYEVVVVDDSTDETVKILEKWKDHPRVKVIHRKSRSGFKGGALKVAMEKMDPKTEFIIVFDADFIPYPDTIEMFLKYFKANNNGSEDYKKSNVAVVQGYQWHVLNKSENWITRGVRAEYAGSYVIERSGTELLGALKQIAGSVYMIRADVLKKFGWKTSITEDFELTLRIYEEGYKVIYTPYIQGPAECVSTLNRLIRQRMRWAEGHSNNIKKMFFRLIASPKLTFSEKLEFLYLSPYYFQATFFLVGTLSWLLAETAIFRARLPFWSSLWGWSLVLTNFLSLPLMNTVGLFLEESEERDYLGLISFVVLSYILVPFQAYASVKGFIEKKEGPWFRTPKTGKITDIFTRGRFYRWIRGILPWSDSSIAASMRPLPATIPAYRVNPYLALTTANNQFSNFSIRPKRLRWVSKTALAILLAISVTIFSLTRGVPEVLATNPNATQYLSNDASGVLTGVTSAWKLLDTVDSPQGSTSITIDRNEAVDAQLQIEPGQTNTTTGTKCSSTPNGRGWILDTVFGSGGSIASGTWSFFIYESDNGPNRQGHIDVCVYRTTVSGGLIGTANLLFQSQGDSSWSTTDTMNNATDSISQTTSSQSSFTIGPNEYLYVEYWYDNENKVNEASVTMTFYTGESGASDPNIVTPGIAIPEKAIIFAVLSPLIPFLVSKWMKKRKETLELLNN